MRKKVFLASMSLSKYKAVKKAFRVLHVAADVICLNVESGVSSHPIGDETALGALNRLTEAQKNLTKYNIDWDFIISVEGGYFEEPEDNFYLQSKCAIISREARTLLQGQSASLPISPIMFKQAERQKSIRSSLDYLLDCDTEWVEYYDFVNIPTDSKPEKELIELSGKTEIVGVLSDYKISRSEIDANMLVLNILPFLMPYNYGKIDNTIT